MSKQHNIPEITTHTTHTESVLRNVCQQCIGNKKTHRSQQHRPAKRSTQTAELSIFFECVWPASLWCAPCQVTSTRHTALQRIHGTQSAILVVVGTFIMLFVFVRSHTHTRTHKGRTHGHTRFCAYAYFHKHPIYIYALLAGCCWLDFEQQRTHTRIYSYVYLV